MSLEIYYDHYKDTFEQQKSYIAKRDRLTLMLLIFAILLLGLIFDPSTISEKLNAIIGSQVANLAFDLQFLNTGLILVTFWYLLQYYMVVLQIEKMYCYLSECEKRLTEVNSDFPINREGAYYLKSYPWLKDVADYIFVLGIPVGFIVLSIYKIVNEWLWLSNLRFVDIAFLVLIIFFSLLYISNRKLKEEYFDKEVHPTRFWYQRLLGYFKIKEY